MDVKKASTNVWQRYWSRLKRIRELGLLIGLLAFCTIISLATPYFLVPLNIFNVLRQVSVYAILAVGETLVLVAGGIDLSIGSIASMAGVVAAWLLGRGFNPWIAILCGILSGTIAGLANGVVVTKIKINSFIATLGMLSIVQGVALLITGGLPLSFRGPFQFIGQGKVWDVPVPVIIMTIIVIIAAFFIKRSVLARKIFAVGGNERAAAVSGIRNDWIRIIVFMICGTLSALGGIIIGANLAVADPVVAQGYMLDVITAVVIGGASLSGGEGSAWGALLGAAIMGVIRNAFVMLHVSGYWQLVVMGLVVIISVAVDSLTNKKSSVA
jgi:ribose transport system permease protein